MIVLPISTRGQPTKYSIDTFTTVAGDPSVGLTRTIRGAQEEIATEQQVTRTKSRATFFGCLIIKMPQ
jgi:hypothetical protein